MKPGVSTLNPYAASYIPLSKREAPEVIAKVCYSGNQTICFGPEKPTTQNRYHEKPSFINEASVLKRHFSCGFYGSSSQNSTEMTEHHMMDDSFEMHLVYLQMQFPAISDESLNEAYIANKGDLEATVDMLHQLEFDPFESPENLPDSLDIGDVFELGSSAKSSSVKLKIAVGEASDSSSGSSESDSIVVT